MDNAARLEAQLVQAKERIANAQWGGVAYDLGNKIIETAAPSMLTQAQTELEIAQKQFHEALRMLLEKLQYFQVEQLQQLNSDPQQEAKMPRLPPSPLLNYLNNISADYCQATAMIAEALRKLVL